MLRCETATKLLVRCFTVEIVSTSTGKAVPQVAQATVPPTTNNAVNSLIPKKHRVDKKIQIFNN